MKSSALAGLVLTAAAVAGGIAGAVIVATRPKAEAQGGEHPSSGLAPLTKSEIQPYKPAPPPEEPEPIQWMKKLIQRNAKVDSPIRWGECSIALAKPPFYVIDARLSQQNVFGAWVKHHIAVCVSNRNDGSIFELDERNLETTDGLPESYQNGVMRSVMQMGMGTAKIMKWYPDGSKEVETMKAFQAAITRDSADADAKEKASHPPVYQGYLVDDVTVKNTVRANNGEYLASIEDKIGKSMFAPVGFRFADGEIAEIDDHSVTIHQWGLNNTNHSDYRIIVKTLNKTLNKTQPEPQPK